MTKSDAEQARIRLIARRTKRANQYRARVMGWSAAAGISEQRLSDPQLFVENAGRLADHVPLPAEACDYLYPRSGQSSRTEWELGIRECIALRAMLKAGLFVVSDLMSLIDSRAEEEAASQISTTKGTLVVGNHGSFEPVLWATFSKLCTNGILITATPDNSIGTYSAFRDPAAALFAGRRILLDGGQLFMAPDGVVPSAAGVFDSKRKPRTLSILGLDWPVGPGAPFLAHETNAQIVSLTVRLTDRGFAPKALRGPVRETNETLLAFAERFWHFYAQQIENTLTGDPRNVPIARVVVLLMRANERKG